MSKLKALLLIAGISSVALGRRADCPALATRHSRHGLDRHADGLE
jgi:hypothetical protein